MSSEAQNVIAEVVAKHEFDGVERDRIRDRIIGLCSCGKRVRTHPRSSHAEHVAEEIDKALGGLTREEQWVPVEESGDRWTGRSREAAEANLKVFSVTGICHDPADDSPLVRIEHEARWVSGWSEA
ncbi:hypothetical protein SG4_86 [Mycobacterium phage SG4]|uniref:Uncharacterized protein n=1 Tax=Mycobacterium phage SG4 TaxID=2923001 RepID=G8I9V2_9CAUD|nr:hypothetical protein CL94_gp086 [Mycobacterium phage SG4]AER49496.1 hypothetical protein SG4_86 [Mycobacterium phage SG4]USH45169.1 hypothetical protein SEA_WHATSAPIECOST_76 [Mycobacterium phage Whatsapiecost]